MGNLDLLHYIEQARKSGMGDEQIRQGLSQSGWAETDVNEALMNAPAVSSPAVKPKAMMSKSLAIIFTVAALAVAGYFASAYYFTNYQNLPLWPFEGEAVAPVPTFTPRPAVKDPTVDWKVYRNEEYGFEFRYPGDLTFRINITPESNYLPGAKEYRISNVGLYQINSDGDIPLSIIVDSRINSASKPCKETLIEVSGPSPNIAETVNIDGHIFIKVGSLYCLDKNDIRFTLNTAEPKDGTLIHQILSTFKFTK